MMFFHFASFSPDRNGGKVIYSTYFSFQSVYYVATSTSTALSLLQEIIIKKFNEKLNNHKTVYHQERKKRKLNNLNYSNQQSIKQPQPLTQGRSDSSKIKLEKNK